MEERKNKKKKKKMSYKKRIAIIVIALLAAITLLIAYLFFGNSGKDEKTDAMLDGYTTIAFFTPRFASTRANGSTSASS